MTNYTKSTNFATKDALASGNALKIVKGTEIDTEFNNIATAVATKADLASPTFTGTVTIPTLAVSSTLAVTGASTLTGVVTLTSQPILSSLTASKIVFTDSSKGLVSAGTLGADQGGTGVANNAAMTVTGSGNYAYTRTLTAATNVTFPTTGTLSTLAGSETLTNKTLTSPVIAGTPTGVGVLTSGTAVTASGTAVLFSSIPSWVKRITIMFNGLSSNGSLVWLVQVGSGSVTTSGYLGCAQQLNPAPAIGAAQFSTGFGVQTNDASIAVYGHMVLTNISGNVWVESHVMSNTGFNYTNLGGGNVTLSGVLDRINITTLNQIDSFDAGTINILYE